MKATCKSYDSDVQMGEKIFDPFEINDIDSNIIDYQGDIDPDKNYFNQLSHHLSKSSNYHTEESFNKFILRNNLDKDNLSMIHVNIRSVPANLTGLLSYMSNIEKQFAVIGLTETWLTPFNIETYGINGYNHVGLTRKNSKGAGVSLFITEDSSYSELGEINMIEDYIECLFVKIKGKKQSYVAGVVYRPPNSNVVEFSNTMHYILEKLGRQQCYIMGDFNLDLLKHEKHPPTEQFLDMMYSNAYIPLINRPTRITKETSTLIDNIFTNNYDIKDSLYSGILQTDISDHYIVFHLSESDIINSQKNEYNLVRIANADRIAQYVQSIQNTDWTFLDTYQHCQCYFSKFLTKFKNIYDESFPLVRVKTQYRNRLPWLSKGMKESIKLKNKLYGISLKHPTFYNINRYKTYKNKLTSILKQEEKLYYQSQILANKNNLKKVWTIIKHVINKRRNAKTSDKFIQNNKIITDPKEIANGFNDYFVNIGPGLASKINTSATSYQSYLPESFNSSFFLQPTCENEIKKIIYQLKEGAAGNDGISPKYLKCVSEVIAYPLTRIANLSFEEGVFPEELKCANVIPLYKAKDPMLFNNYRPISLLSVFSKIIERLMYNRLIEFLNKNKFFQQIPVWFPE